MNHKFIKQNLLLPAIVVLVATLGVAPAISESAFAQRQDADKRQDSEVRQDRKRVDSTILFQTSDVRAVDVLENANEVEFSGKTEGWAIIGVHAVKSEIEIEGTAAREDGIWHVDANGTLEVGDREVDFVLKGRANNGHLRLHGTGALDDTQLRIVLVGNYAPIHIEGEYTLGFKGAYVKFSQGGFRIPLMQVGTVTVNQV